MSQQSALESNIDTLRNYIISNDNLKSELKSEITRLITQYNSIKLLGGEDMNKI